MEELETQLFAHTHSLSDVRCPGGWIELIAALNKRLTRIHAQYQIGHIKEKFGGLRFTYSAVPPDKIDTFQEIIARYRDLSYQTCRACGKSGQLVTVGGSYYTLCTNDEIDLRQRQHVTKEQNHGTH